MAHPPAHVGAGPSGPANAFGPAGAPGPGRPLRPPDTIARRAPEISIVIPLRDEETNVIPLHQELSGVMRGLNLSYEIILVDDGSEDRTFERLVEINARDSCVRVIRFTRNFGQSAAFTAGFSHARGRLIVTLDGDLQNDPADIPRLLEVARDHDIVCGWRKARKDAFLTRHVPSVVANWLISMVTGVRLHDQGCSSRSCAQRWPNRCGSHRVCIDTCRRLRASLEDA